MDIFCFLIYFWRTINSFFYFYFFPAVSSVSIFLVYCILKWQDPSTAPNWKAFWCAYCLFSLTLGTFTVWTQIKPCLHLVSSIELGNSCWLTTLVQAADSWVKLTGTPSPWNAVVSLSFTVVGTTVYSSAEQESEQGFNWFNNQPYDMGCIWYVLQLEWMQQRISSCAPKQAGRLWSINVILKTQKAHRTVRFVFCS